MRLAIREEPVDDHAQDREEEDKKRPEELVRRRAVGFDDFDCLAVHNLLANLFKSFFHFS